MNAPKRNGIYLKLSGFLIGNKRICFICMRKKELQESILTSSVGSVPVSELQLLQNYVAHLNVQIEKKNEDVRQAEQKVQLKQHHLNERMMDEKVWSKAKEKAYEKFRVTALKKEQEMLDEMATVRHKRMSY
ncbi:flagellar export protein FliJ [Paenibacillus larvae]|nr:flagellar export protein FliJ [Paenibacillus larvae]MDT2285503.1 flagellar export protein FliJ [Paenibacillus larvae]